MDTFTVKMTFFEIDGMDYTGVVAEVQHNYITKHTYSNMRDINHEKWQNQSHTFLVKSLEDGKRMFTTDSDFEEVK